MKLLNDVRNQAVREDPRMRLGEVRFVPTGYGGPTEKGHASMTEATWQLLTADEELGRRYLTERARAMRKAGPSYWSVAPDAARRRASAAQLTISLETLEDTLDELARFIGAMPGDADLATAQGLLQRRKEARAMLVHIQNRVAHAGNQLDVIDELLSDKVA